MQSLEILLDLLAIIFVLYATYGHRNGDNLVLAGDISSLELMTQIAFGSGQTQEEEDDLPPWDVDELIDSLTQVEPEPSTNTLDETTEGTQSPELKVPEEGLIPFDVDEPDIPSRNEVFNDYPDFDVTQITAKKAWKAAKALGLPYKNPDKSRIKVTVLRQNIEAYLRENPSQFSDVLPFVG
ncbi:hypothetical protein cce_4970 [Crocosphaera subtropica ATCC 51142]|uniref:Uncharacterized protein n=1 Tax=Crocosphaera subtropica (strain ATCC 51142 / BH68) TaxID=43989 RepID=B1X2F5_CROS5|nr:hypothetical protein [Crocosphaera subtropica]ACB54316.1 hypothetical protein cce_4970 [Crocosphaera subtropica ATCC 51142]